MDRDKPIELWKYHARLRRDLAEQLQRSSQLIRDTHHRMANGLQVIASSAANQIRDARNPEAVAVARRILARTQSIARTYRVLLLDDGNIDLAGNLNQLGDELQGLLSPSRTISITTEAAPFFLPSAVAAPLVFIAHELVSNAAKHAFANRAAGTIRVRLTHPHPEYSKLAVSDDGIGLPRGFQRGGGLTLVTELAESIAGMVVFGSTPGCEARVFFPSVPRSPMVA